MSWLTPEPGERALVDGLRHAGSDDDRNLFTLAARLAPALRIDARLLRNARLRFVPDSDAGLEARLWQCHLVERRARRSITFHPGLARALLDALAENGEQLDATLAFVDEHTREWNPLDRLEQQLRLDAWRDRSEHIAANLRPVLRAIVEAPGDDARTEIARWARQALPAIAGHDSAVEEAGWLARFATTLLGDPHASLGRPDPRREPLPPWLANHLPTDAGSRIGLALHEGAIVCSEPDPAGTPPGTAVLDLPGPLPAAVLLSVPRESNAEPRWEALWPGHVIPIPRDAREVEIQTTTGARFALAAPLSETTRAGPPVFISYAHSDDVAQAWVERIQERLARERIPYFSALEAMPSGQPMAERIESEIAGARALVCVVSHATAKSQWIERELAFALDSGRQGRELAGPVPIIPVRVEQGALLPSPIADLYAVEQIIDLEGDGDAVLDRLLDRLRVLGNPLPDGSAPGMGVGAGEPDQASKHQPDEQPERKGESPKQQAEPPESDGELPDTAPALQPRIVIVHAPREAEAAALLAKALLAHGIDAQPLPEPEDPSNRSSTRLAEGPDVIFARVWSRDSTPPKPGHGLDDMDDPLRPALVIRIDDNPLPEGSFLANVVDLQGFDGDPYSKSGEHLLAAVRGTLPAAGSADAD